MYVDIYSSLMLPAVTTALLYVFGCALSSIYLLILHFFDFFFSLSLEVGVEFLIMFRFDTLYLAE